MKKGFTIVEVSILFVIFLIVAFLVAPLSVDDTAQARYTSKWKSVQSDFLNIFYSINTQNEEENQTFKEVLNTILESETQNKIKDYKITFMNGTFPSHTYRFKNYKETYTKATIAVKLFDEPKDNLQGLLMYDVNGAKGPNIWGKDVFGLHIYDDRFEPFGKNEAINTQKQDCSKNGTGLFCSNYYLIGGNFD